jgi:hypothetical protein
MLPVSLRSWELILRSPQSSPPLARQCWGEPRYGMPIKPSVLFQPSLIHWLLYVSHTHTNLYFSWVVNNVLMTILRLVTHSNTINHTIHPSYDCNKYAIDYVSVMCTSFILCCVKKGQIWYRKDTYSILLAPKSPWWTELEQRIFIVKYELINIQHPWVTGETDQSPSHSPSPWQTNLFLQSLWFIFFYHHLVAM